MKTEGLTTEQVEREQASCYGRRIEYINYYEQISEEPEYEQCESCGYWFYPDKIRRTGEGESLCEDDYQIYLTEKEEGIYELTY